MVISLFKFVKCEIPMGIKYRLAFWSSYARLLTAQESQSSGVTVDV
jgi:hypothetical protein